MKKSAKKYQPLILARRKAGLTQLFAAKHCRVALRTYCHWEAGTGAPGTGSLSDYVLLLDSFTAPSKTKPATVRSAPVPCAGLVIARKKAGLTQYQAAKALKVSLRTYQHWELGTTTPKQGLAAFVAALSSVPPPTPCVLCGHVSKSV